MIEQAENVLRDLGFRICRVRHHDTHRAGSRSAATRWPARWSPDVAETIDRALRALGYRARDARPARLSARQPQRRAPPAPRSDPRLVRKALVGARRRCLARGASRRSLPPTLEDIDSINFALGVRRLRRRPAPAASARLPGLHRARQGLDVRHPRAAGVPPPDVRGLAIWSALRRGARAAAVLVLFRAQCRGPGRRPACWRQPSPVACWATVVAVRRRSSGSRPLRPLSDTDRPGRGIAAQALIACASIAAGPAAVRARLRCRWRFRRRPGDRHPIADGAADLPLLGLALVLPRTGLRARGSHRGARGAAVGVLVWAIPLIVASGGLAAYLRRSAVQAGEDFSGVVMLWTTRTARVAARRA